MLDDELRVEDAPRPEDVALLHDRLYEHNVGVVGRADARWLTILVRDGGGELTAGLHGWTWAGVGFVQLLWVRADQRGRGLGAKLLDAGEAEAARRGCREMHLDTHSFQAPGFYRRRGYELLGELPGWPRGTTRFFFRKPLAAPTA